MTHLVVDRLDAELGAERLLQDDRKVVEEQLMAVPVARVEPALEDGIPYPPSLADGEAEGVGADDKVAAVEVLGPLDAARVIVLRDALGLGLRVGRLDTRALLPVGRELVLPQAVAEILPQMPDVGVKRLLRGPLAR